MNGTMKNKILVLGMNPASRDSTYKKNHTNDRLQQWARYLDISYDFDNIVTESGDVKGKKPDINRLLDLTKHRSIILALGNFSSSWLQKLKVEHFKLPHPSPRNRMINDQDNILRILNECKDYINERKSRL